ncbi:MAG: Nucleotide binding protein [Candidatus Nomurabacteria bacterium GW2011_GWB1_37_5]|uniref:Nucleotide binding protein n=1 Tax=Candidatus Nomurabacteria bacterium GW2011_GWB1_37_5 TaxID=1618742 RepID=A0A0G0GVU7_9BACT|nr:MAG: Nucleotide binding protein [Candidatus Nomurabacteria bacterium GW2011_GWB1_37_5]
MHTLDSNVLIYYLNSETKATVFIEKIIKEGSVSYVSTITEIEVLSYKGLSVSEMADIEELFNSFRQVIVDSNIVKIASEIRRHSNLKTPDAIIAATAIFTGTKLVTRNTKDFKKVKGLSLIEI